MSAVSFAVTIDDDSFQSDTANVLQSSSEPIGTVYCSCQSAYCDCGSALGVTEAAAREIYRHLGFTEGHDAIQSQGYRANALHLWGTHNLGTKQILTWLEEYKPSKIEWINDASCNVVFLKSNSVLRVLVDYAEPFDRRVALAAAATLVSVLEKEDDGDLSMSAGQQQQQSTDNTELLDGYLSHQLSTESAGSIEEFSQYLPPAGRWYKALSVPTGAISLFLRMAHQSDIKLPGAERRSVYYRRYGNPNYGGLTGILSRSNRRRLKLAEFQPGSQTDTRNINLLTDSDVSTDFEEAIARVYVDPDAITTPTKAKRLKTLMNLLARANGKSIPPAPRRQLIVYDNLNELSGTITTDGLTKHHRGTRREAVDFGVPNSSRQPRKWPRKVREPIPNRWPFADLPNGQATEEDDDDDYLDNDDSLSPSDRINVVDLRQLIVSKSSNSRSSAHKRSKRTAQMVLSMDTYATTTITLMPDPPLSPEPISAEADNTDRTHRLLASLSMVADQEEVTSNRSMVNRLGSLTHRQHLTTESKRPRTGNVWDRLG